MRRFEKLVKGFLIAGLLCVLPRLVQAAADVNFAISGPYGQNTFDARQASDTDLRQVFVLGDATTTANVAPVSATSGLAVEPRSSTVATFSASTGAFTPAATPTDIVTIAGSASKTIKVTRIKIETTQTTAGINTWLLTKRSAADTAGTSVALVKVPHDSSNAAASATVLQYTANPTLGNAVGNIWIGLIDAPAPATAGTGALEQTIDFISLFGQPIILRGIAEQLAINFNGAALPTGLSVQVTVTWTEE